MSEETENKPVEKEGQQTQAKKPTRKKCDYCNRWASHTINVCTDHLTVLDQKATRRKDHLIAEE